MELKGVWIRLSCDNFVLEKNGKIYFDHRRIHRKNVDYAGVNLKEAREQAKNDGWFFRKNGEILCPACACYKLK